MEASSISLFFFEISRTFVRRNFNFSFPQVLQLKYNHLVAELGRNTQFQLLQMLEHRGWPTPTAPPHSSTR